MTIPIGRFLTEFSSPAFRQSGPAIIPMCAAAMERSEAETAAALETAHEAGYRAATADAAQKASEREAELVAAHAAELQSASTAWVEAESEGLARMLRDSLDGLEHRIASAAAALLRPLLPQALMARTLAELDGALGTLLTGSDPQPIVVAGRADLVQSLERRFSDRPGVSFQPAEAPEVTILAGDTTIRSALQGWADRLAQDLASHP